MNSNSANPIVPAPISHFESSTGRRKAAFVWKIVCRSGVLSFGCHADFLLCIVRARQQKAQLAALLPSSTFRVQLLCPNRQRVSRIDIKAALLALADARINAAVLSRLDAPAAVPPAARARTERTASASKDLVDVPQSIFCQAGVVAPPDSPDLGNPVEIACVAVEV